MCLLISRVKSVLCCRQSSGFTKVVKNVEDGQSWRKYGQKDIQNSEHPK